MSDYSEDGLGRSRGASPFPKDDLDPKKKEENQWGLQVAKAIWGYNQQYDTNLFYRDRTRYRQYVKYALGKQDESKYKPFLGLKPNDNEKSWLTAINFQIKNYATKRVNIAVSKIMEKDYDVTVNTTDPISKDIRKNIERRLRLQMQSQKELAVISNILGTNVADQNIPSDEDELQLLMDMDYRMQEAIHLEMAIPHHLARNRYERIRAHMAFDLFVLGAGCMYAGMDENIRPTIERVNPADLIVPYNENPDFNDIPYIARMKWYTPSEFRTLATGYLSEDEIDEYIERFQKRESEDYTYTSDFKRYDDVGRISVLHYNYRSTDTFTFLQKPDPFGNSLLYEKPIDYYARPKEIDKFRNKFGESRKIIRQTVNAVYEGFWVIGSKKVIRHGRRGYSTGRYGVVSDDAMGFKLFAPNAWDGYMVSTGAQMIPMLDELQKYNLKIQQLVSRAIPKGIGIDLYALRKANLKWGGKEMTDQSKIEMFMRAGIFIYSSKDRYAPGSNYKPFYEAENGLANDIDRYLRLIQQSLFELDEIIGINKATAASQLREDAGKAVTELQISASETALDYLYRADKDIRNDVVQTTGVMHIKSWKYSSKNRERYSRMFGSTGDVNVDLDFDNFDYDFNIEARPTDAEWREIYLSAEKAYDKGIINYSDTLMLRDMTSIKQARRFLMMREKQSQRRAAEQAQSATQDNAAVQEASLKAKGIEDRNLEDHKLKNNLILEEAKRQTIKLEQSLKVGHEEVKQSSTGDEKIKQIDRTSERKKEEIILEDELADNSTPEPKKDNK